MIQQMKRSLSMGLSGLAMAFAMVAGDAQALGTNDSGSFNNVMNQLEAKGQRVVATAMKGVGGAEQRRLIFTANEAGNVAYILSGTHSSVEDQPRELKVDARLEDVRLIHKHDWTGLSGTRLRDEYKTVADSACDAFVANGRISPTYRQEHCGFLNDFLSHDLRNQGAHAFIQGRLTQKDGNGGHVMTHVMMTVTGNFIGYRPAPGFPLDYPANIYQTSLAVSQAGLTLKEPGRVRSLRASYTGQFIFTVPRNH